MEKHYRKGAIGALMDEYERAILEFKAILQHFSEDEFVAIKDSVTQNEDCRSIQTIVNHVIESGRFYADNIRKKFAMSETAFGSSIPDLQRAIAELDYLIEYTSETLQDHWEMPDAEILATFIETGVGFTENLEQVLEHAVVHVLRHRRQVEKFLR